MRTTGIRCSVESDYDVQNEINTEVLKLEEQLKLIDIGDGKAQIIQKKNYKLIVISLIERLTEELKK